jgi:DNA-binding NtrC family response regulator
MPGGKVSAGGAESPVSAGFQGTAGGGGITPSSLSLPLREARNRMLTEFEREYLVAQLRAARGRVGETAKRAGITPRALFDKMKRHGLRKEDFKD